MTYAAISLALAFVIATLGSFGAGYDDGGLGTAGFVLGFVWSIVAFPFSLSSELLFELNSGRAVPGHELLSLLSGLLICACAEALLFWYRKTRKRKFRNE